MTKTTEAIQHITAGELADDPDEAIKEFDMAAALIDELSSSLATQQQDDAEVAGSEEEEPEEGDDGREPGADEPEGEQAEGSARGSVTEKAGMVGEMVGQVKESVPTPLALAGLGVVAGLGTLGAIKALSGRGDGTASE